LSTLALETPLLFSSRGENGSGSGGPEYQNIC